MQTSDIAKSTQCWCERIWAADLARSAPAQMIFFQHPLTAPLPLMPFSARSAPFSAPLTLRSHALVLSHVTPKIFGIWSNISAKLLELETSNLVHGFVWRMTSRRTKSSPKSGRGLGHVTPTIFAVRSAILATAGLLAYFSHIHCYSCLLYTSDAADE